MSRAAGPGDQRRPRSLLITFDYPPTVGGIAAVLGRFWRLAGHGGCLILAPGGPGAADFDARHPVRTVRFPGGGGRALTFLAGAAASLLWMLRHRPQLVVAGQLVRAGPLAWLFHLLTRRPYDLWVYGGETDDAFTGLAPLTRFLHRVLRGARTVFSNSAYTTQEMIAFGLPAERVVELPLGVDTERYRPRPADPELVRRYDVEGRLVLLTVGRLVERKGVDRMLQALAEVRAELPDWRYLVVSDGPYRPALEALSRRLGLEEHVRFTGFVDDAELPGLYNLCDIFAMPNREVRDPDEGSLSVEGFGIVFLEAAASGKPVIAGRSGGAVHAVDEGRTGYLVEDDPQQLRAALRELADPALRQRMGAAGVDFARRFDWERSAARLADYL